MKLSTVVVVPLDDETHELATEVADDVITFYLDNREIFSMDFEGNFVEFVIAIMRLWGGWKEGKTMEEVKDE